MKNTNLLLLIAPLLLSSCLEYKGGKYNYKVKTGEGESNPGDPPEEEIGSEPEVPGDPEPEGEGSTKNPSNGSGSNDPMDPMNPGDPMDPNDPKPPSKPVVSTFKEKPITSYADLGKQVNVREENGVIITEGVIRPRRRHENDMDFAKYNPFYWEGRESYFRIDDYTKKGEKKMKFTMKTDWPQNYIPTRGPDFSAIYTGSPLAADETTRSKFAINARMHHLGEFKNFEWTIDEGAFNVHANELKQGNMLMFEFRFFMDEGNPNWQKQKQVNHHNLSAYYSEFFRTKVGEGGLYIDDVNDSKKFPPPQKHAGGWLTTPIIKVEPWRALQQQSNNLLAASSQTFLNGRTWFHTDMIDGHHQGDEADDKPSVFYPEEQARRKGHAGSAYNANACNACHYNNGIHLLPDQGKPVMHTLAKTSNKKTGMDHKSFGLQLQTAGANSEGSLKVVKVETKDVMLADGTKVTLKKNIFEIDSPLDKTDLGLSIRRPLALTGVGLLNAIPDETIKSFVGRRGGEVSMVNGKVSRFGWKADQPNLIDQIAAAARNDLAVTSDLFPKLDCTNGCKEGKAKLPMAKFEEIETYISLLGVPPRTNPTDARVMEGEKIFRMIGCANCHIPNIQTGPSRFKEVSNQSIQPFTDLLLHDMGPGLADDSGRPNASKWRTPPLWALKNVRAAMENHTDKFPSGNIMILWTDTHKEAAKNRMQFLHDGRASTIQEAILWHGGEAEGMVELYKRLSKEDRDKLEAFLWDI